MSNEWWTWGVVLRVFAGMLLVSISAVAENRWVDVAFWVTGYVVLMKACKAAYRRGAEVVTQGAPSPH